MIGKILNWIMIINPFGTIINTQKWTAYYQTTYQTI